MYFTISYCESARVVIQFQHHDQYSTVTQALVLAPENLHISLTNTLMRLIVLNCTEWFIVLALHFKGSMKQVLYKCMKVISALTRAKSASCVYPGYYSTTQSTLRWPELHTFYCKMEFCTTYMGVNDIYASRACGSKTL